MATFSDDEPMFAVDSILQQRKRKGVLEYLVKWKETGDDGVTWEPATNIKKDCALAVEHFEKVLKTRSKRSSSRSRRSSQSRSRSRSSSRSRKPRESSRKKTTRSHSQGRKEESPDQKSEVAKAGGDSEQKKAASTTTTTVTEETVTRSSSSSQAEQSKQSEMPAQKKTEVTTTTSSSSSSGRVLRSSTTAEKSTLEVQRVHNEQRPVREDDTKPRSAVWKIADYAVIVLFIISALAALLLFVEKFVDLEEFKKQAFPNLTVLQGRLDHVRERIVDLATAACDTASDLWLQVVEQVKGTPSATATAPPTPAK